MRPFIGWPRWAVEILRKVLVVVGVMPGLLFRLDCEAFARDVVEWADAVAEADARGWACVGIRGLQ